MQWKNTSKLPAIRLRGLKCMQNGTGGPQVTSPGGRRRPGPSLTPCSVLANPAPGLNLKVGRPSRTGGGRGKQGFRGVGAPGWPSRGGRGTTLRACRWARTPIDLERKNIVFAGEVRNFFEGPIGALQLQLHKNRPLASAQRTSEPNSLLLPLHARLHKKLFGNQPAIETMKILFLLLKPKAKTYFKTI